MLFYLIFFSDCSIYYLVFGFSSESYRCPGCPEEKTTFGRLFEKIRDSKYEVLRGTFSSMKSFYLLLVDITWLKQKIQRIPVCQPKQSLKQVGSKILMKLIRKLQVKNNWSLASNKASHIFKSK